jgi:hypothetical protein
MTSNASQKQLNSSPHLTNAGTAPIEITKVSAGVYHKIKPRMVGDIKANLKRNQKLINNLLSQTVYAQTKCVEKQAHFYNQLARNSNLNFDKTGKTFEKGGISVVVSS